MIKEKLEHAFKAGRISDNTTFEEWYKTFGEITEQPNEIEVGNLVIDKLKHDEYWSNPRNRRTRIVTEILMRECYFTGWNNAINS